MARDDCWWWLDISLDSKPTPAETRRAARDEIIAACVFWPVVLAVLASATLGVVTAVRWCLH